MTEAQPRARPLLATLLAGAFLGVGVVGMTIAGSGDFVKPLTLVLALCAVIAELAAARYSRQLTISGAFIATMLAAGFLGPAAAFAIPVLSYCAVWVVDRYRWRALVINLAGSATPALLAAIVIGAIDPHREGFGFVLLLAAAAAGTMALNFGVVAPLMALLDGHSVLDNLRLVRNLVPAVALNIALLAVIAEIYAELGLTALVFVLLNVLAFSYMARLVVVARERTREYANLSWGVLSGLIRTLDERDSRAGR